MTRNSDLSSNVRRRLLLIALAPLLLGASACSSSTIDDAGAATPAPVMPTADSLDATPPAAATAPPVVATATSPPTAEPSTTAPAAATATATATAATAAGPTATAASEIDRPAEQVAAATQGLGSLGDTELELETSEGTVQIGAGEVPADAATFPVPDDLSVQLSSATETDLGFAGTTALPLNEVTAFYELELPAAGFTILDQQGAAGSFARFQIESSRQVGDVVVTRTPGADSTTIVIALATP